MRTRESTQRHGLEAAEPLRRLRSSRGGPVPSASHETLLGLQRSAGNASVQRMLVQRQDPPSVGSSLSLPSRSRGFSLLGGEQLHLDPQIEAQANAYRARMELERILHPPDLLTAIRDLPITLTPPPDPAMLTTPPTQEQPLVPRGAGPDTQREGSAGDVMGAIAAVPAVDRAITRLRTQALSQVSRDWSRLSTGDRVLLITTTALIGGGALAGIASDPGARSFMLDQLNGRELGVPGVDGLSVTFNTRPENLGVMLTYDLAPLISRATGM
jgi:hypothetical protein